MNDPALRKEPHALMPLDTRSREGSLAIVLTVAVVAACSAGVPSAMPTVPIATSGQSPSAGPPSPATTASPASPETTFSPSPRPGHPNFEGQYEVAEKVVDYLSELGVKKMIVVAGYGTKDKKVVCAANSKKAIDELKEKYDIGVGYKGPFMGFSGLVFGSAQLKGIEAICLFSGSEPKEDDLESPDKEASDRVVEILNRMFSLPN